MKLSQLKEEIKQVLRERTVIAIQKEYQKTVEEIGKALEFYKKNKLTDKKDAFVKVLKQHINVLCAYIISTLDDIFR